MTSSTHWYSSDLPSNATKNSWRDVGEHEQCENVVWWITIKSLHLAIIARIRLVVMSKVHAGSGYPMSG